jgi:hypothetical protein
MEPATRLASACAVSDIQHPEISRKAATTEQVPTCLGIVFLERRSSAHDPLIVSAILGVSYLSAGRFEDWNYGSCNCLFPTGGLTFLQTF